MRSSPTQESDMTDEELIAMNDAAIMREYDKWV